MTYTIGTFAAAAAAGADIPAEVKLVRTSGYAEEGDGGEALFAEAEARPVSAARFQDLYHRWFGLAGGQPLAAEMFGAAGDGASDDSAAIQAALDAPETGILRLAARRYALAAPIEVPAGKRLEGSGAGATALTVAPGFPAGAAAVRLGEGGGAILCDLSLEGPGADGAAGADGVLARGAGFRVARVRVSGFAGRGLAAEGSAAAPASGRFEHVAAENCGTLLAVRDADDVSCLGFEGASGEGDVAIAAAVRIEGAARGILLSGLRFAGAAAAGIRIDATGAGGIEARMEDVEAAMESDGPPLLVSGGEGTALRLGRCRFRALPAAAGGTSPGASIETADLFAANCDFEGTIAGLAAADGRIEATGCRAKAATGPAGGAATTALLAGTGAAAAWTGGSLEAAGPAGLAAAFAGDCKVSPMTALSPLPPGGNPLAVADGGTGATDAAGARAALGLGSLATQAADAVAISGGSIGGLASLSCSGPATLGDAAGDQHLVNGTMIVTNRAEFAAGYRVTGINTGGSGPGVELFYSGGAVLISMNRSTGSFHQIVHRGSAHVFQVNGMAEAARLNASALNLAAGVALQVGGTAVVGPRSTGWTAMTGTAAKGAAATYVAPALGDPPTRAELQAMADALQTATRRLKAHDDALFAHGLIGA